MKAITPVITTVMLVLIAVGVVGVFYAWSTGLLGMQVEKSISIPPGAATCSDAGLVTVRIQNNGATSDVADEDVIIAQVGGRDCPKKNVTIAPGQAGMIIENAGCAAACAATTPCSGIVSVKVGTRTGVVESVARCK